MFVPKFCKLLLRIAFPIYIFHVEKITCITRACYSPSHLNPIPFITLKVLYKGIIKVFK